MGHKSQARRDEQRKLAERLANLTAELHEEARSISRMVLLPTIRSRMKAAYKLAEAEHGSGSLARMRGFVEDRVHHTAGSMLRLAAGVG
jgi:hypothetical protein